MAERKFSAAEIREGILRVGVRSKLRAREFASELLDELGGTPVATVSPPQETAPEVPEGPAAEDPGVAGETPENEDPGVEAPEGPAVRRRRRGKGGR